MRFFCLFSLVALVARADDGASRYAELAKKIVRDSQRLAICGEFTTKDGLVERVVFADGDAVKITIGGIDADRRYFVSGRSIRILLDKDLLAFEMDEKENLLGKEGIVLGKKLRRVGLAGRCKPFPEDEASLRRLAETACYLEGVSTQRADPAKAEALYQACCSDGGAMSCNKVGFLKAMRGDAKAGADYFKKACDGGYGGGCANLGDAEYKAKRKTQAITFYKKACELGFREACPKADPELLETLMGR